MYRRRARVRQRGPCVAGLRRLGYRSLVTRDPSDLPVRASIASIAAPPRPAAPEGERSAPVAWEADGAPGRAVVVGVAADVPRALEHPAVLRSGPLTMAGVVVVALDDPDVSARAAELDQLLRSTGASVVLVAGPLGRQTMRAVSDIALLNGCRLLAVMPSEVVAGHEPVVVWQGESPLVQLAAARRTGVQGALKRGLDVAVAALGLVAVAPVMALAAVAIRLDSRGPALFRHRRVGLGGREFDCLKFRSMRQDAEALLAADPALRALYRAHGYKLPETLDHRVTQVGRWLRRSSIDELPQLVNVLRGEMSLVGPRPVVGEELEHYRGSERLFLSMRPGMTGAWAVNGRHHVGYPARAELELGYVRRWSLRADLRILAATIRAVLTP